MITQPDQPQPFDASPIDKEDGAGDVHALIADEEPTVLWMAEQTLRQDGFATVAAFDGPDALLAAERHGPLDLLITDLYLPSMSGIELALRLRLRDPELKVLYLIEHGDVLLPREMLVAADEAFLEVPCSPRDLLEAVGKLLHRARRREQKLPRREQKLP